MSSNIWISVNDRLPNDDEYVLCYCVTQSQYDDSNNKARITGHYKDGIFTTAFSYMAAFVKGIEVTHWQPLPEPPNTENK